MVSAASSRLFPSPRSRPFALLSALFRLRCHGVGAGMFMLRAWGNGACAFSHNRGVFRFLRHGVNSAGGGGCRAGRMASAGRCAYFYRLARPLPLGAGDYVRPAGIGSACGEGVGGIVEVLLSIGSSSFHLFIAVVIVSPCLLSLPPSSHPRLSLLASSSCSRCLVLAPLSSPLPCRLRPFLSPVFSYRFLIASLPVLAISRAGRSLLACPCVVALVPFALLSLRLVPYPLRLLGVVFARRPRRLSHRLMRLLRPAPPVSLVSRRPPLLFVLSPRLATSVWRGAWRLVICLLALVLVVRTAG